MEIDLKAIALDLRFHPSTNLIATCLISGRLHLYRYAAEAESRKLLDVQADWHSCFSLSFIKEGSAIVTGTFHGSLIAIDAETGSTISHLDNYHGETISRIVNLTESTIASGDDKGCIKIWDFRQRSCCSNFKGHTHYISDMTFASDSMQLLGASGDGSISVCNLRGNQVQTISEYSEEELQSVVIMKNGRKVICGTLSGTLLLYSRERLEAHSSTIMLMVCLISDHYVGLCPNSVDTLIKLDEDRIITGSINGLMSVIDILPNRIDRTIFEQCEDYPVEHLASSHDKKFVGWISNDALRISDVDKLVGGSENNMPNHYVARDAAGGII